MFQGAMSTSKAVSHVASSSQTVRQLFTHLLPCSYSWHGVLRASAHRAGASNVLAPPDLHQMRKLVSWGSLDQGWFRPCKH